MFVNQAQPHLHKRLQDFLGRDHDRARTETALAEAELTRAKMGWAQEAMRWVETIKPSDCY